LGGRFGLVPRKLKEEIFWRNYFYQVELTKAACCEEEEGVAGEGTGSVGSSKPGAVDGEGRTVPQASQQEVAAASEDDEAAVVAAAAAAGRQRAEAEENQRLRTEALLAQMEKELEPEQAAEPRPLTPAAATASAAAPAAAEDGATEAAAAAAVRCKALFVDETLCELTQTNLRVAKQTGNSTINFQCLKQVADRTSSAEFLQARRELAAAVAATAATAAAQEAEGAAAASAVAAQAEGEEAEVAAAAAVAPELECQLQSESEPEPEPEQAPKQAPQPEPQPEPQDDDFDWEKEIDDL